MSIPQPMGSPLASAQDAIDRGYADGKELQDNGALPGHLDIQREMKETNYLRSPFYGDWVRGFHAGYSGQRKPEPGTGKQ